MYLIVHVFQDIMKILRETVNNVIDNVKPVLDLLTVVLDVTEENKDR